MPTKVELEDRISELEGENQTLNDKLDSILDIAVANGDPADEELAVDDTTEEGDLSDPDDLSDEDGDELPATDLSDDEEDDDLAGPTVPSPRSGDRSGHQRLNRPSRFPEPRSGG